MEGELSRIRGEGRKPRLLLHLCCAPCSSYVIDLLAEHFELTLYFYDPNIHPYEEYVKRRDEAKTHAEKEGITFIEGPYDVERWHEITKGHEKDPEKGDRCTLCYDMRLREAARFGTSAACEYFTSVLSVSPHKDAKKINDIGFALSLEMGISYLPADFKKKEGFKKSMVKAREKGFYRQDYCGCLYSKVSRHDAKMTKE